MADSEHGPSLNIHVVLGLRDGTTRSRLSGRGGADTPVVMMITH